MGVILGIISLIFIYILKNRVDRLEKLLSGSPKPNSTSQVFVPQGVPKVAPIDSMNGALVNTIPQQAVPLSYADSVDPASFEGKNFHDGDAFMAWLKEDFLMKVGGLFLLMALGWFVSFAFANDWIGPMGRITLGLLLGAAILALGVWRIRLYEHQGAILTVLGSSTLILTIAAGRSLYNFFTPMSALVLIFLSVLFVAFVSLRYNRIALALVGLFMAAYAPYFVAGLQWDVMEKFSFLLMVVAGTLWVVYIKGWRLLTLVALAIVFMETLPYLMSYSDKVLVLLWVFLFVAIFFIANMISIIRVRGAVLSNSHLLTALGTVVFLILWVFTVAPKESQSLLFVFWMLVFSFGAYIAFRATDNRVPFYVYGATSLTLLASATAAEVEGAVLVIAYTLEIAVIVCLAKYYLKDQKVVSLLGMLFAVPVLLSLESIISSDWRYGVLHADFFVLMILGLALIITGLFILEQSRIRGEKRDSLSMTLIVGGVIYGLMLIWLVLHALILNEDVATMVTLIIYTIIGVALYVTGRTHDKEGLRVGGSFLIGIVIVRLLFVEVWEMELAGRIITFAAIGVMLISTAFMRRSKTASKEISSSPQ